jgi:hypothetical protein
MSRSQNTGSRGSRVSVSSGGRVVRDEYQKESLEPKPADAALTRSTGCSVSVGHSTDYGRDKFEVSVWSTVPCGDSFDEESAAFDQCVGDVMERLENLRKYAVTTLKLPFEAPEED